MNRKAIAVRVATLLAMGATFVWVPVRIGWQSATLASAQRTENGRVVWHHQWEWGEWKPGEMDSDASEPEGILPSRYCWSWDRWQLHPHLPPPPPSTNPIRGGSTFDKTVEQLSWPMLLLEHVAIALIAAGVLFWIVRRERRRKASA